MTPSICIDVTKCTACRVCIKICPAAVFESVDKRVQVVHPDDCIGCSHCVCACPSQAISHNLFSSKHLHSYSQEALPTPEQVRLLCRTRRSNRSFTKKALEAREIELILEAANAAPTASNKQNVGYTVIQDPEKIQDAIDFCMSSFIGLYKVMNHPMVRPIVALFSKNLIQLLPKVKRMIDLYHVGQDPILRGATTLLLIHAPKGQRFADADCNLAYQNASLMAESLGIGQVYTGFLCNALGRKPNNAFIKSLGIHQRVHAGMALGHVSVRYHSFADRSEVSVNRFANASTNFDNETKLSNEDFA